METSKQFQSRLLLLNCLSACKYLTYKEWKRCWLRLSLLWSCRLVSTLPIRNGNLIVALCSDVSVSFLVSTLPIRNGNSKASAFTLLGCRSCKYLTYKEWKQHSKNHMLLYVVYLYSENVSTLPVRNVHLV